MILAVCQANLAKKDKCSKGIALQESFDSTAALDSIDKTSVLKVYHGMIISVWQSNLYSNDKNLKGASFV